jgi:hypothetical protein
MREFRHLCNDIDSQLEEAMRAKQRLDAERWRDELRPSAMRQLAARTATLRWSRALLNALVAELYPDALFTELVGHLDRVPRRQWPHALAIAVALRLSWRRDGLPRLAKQLRISLTTDGSRDGSHPRHPRPSRRRCSGSPRPRQGAPPPRGGAYGLDRALGRARTGSYVTVGQL